MRFQVPVITKLKFVVTNPMSCFRTAPKDLTSLGLRYLATPDDIEVALLAEGGPDAVALWRHCLRQGPNFRFHIDHCARSIYVSAERVRRGFRAMAALRLAWRTEGERGADGRLHGSHWNVSMLPRSDVETAPEPAPDLAPPTPPKNRGSVNPRVTYKEYREEPKTKTTTHVNAHEAREHEIVAEAFADLWEVYPCKSDRPAAERAWFNLIRRGGLEGPAIERLWMTLFVDIERRKLEEWHKPKFVPHLKNYLFKRLWNDPPHPRVRDQKTVNQYGPHIPMEYMMARRARYAAPDASESTKAQQEGLRPANSSDSLPALLRASDEGSDHELERSRNSSTHFAQPRDENEPPGAAREAGGRCGGVSEVWPEDYEPAGPWAGAPCSAKLRSAGAVVDHACF